MRYDHKIDVLSVYGYFWQRVWQDPEFISALAEGLDTLQQQSEITYQEFKEYMSRLTVPVFHHQRWKRLTFSKEDLKLRSYDFSDGLQIDKSVLIGSSVPPIQYVLPWVSTLQTSFITDSLDLETDIILNAEQDYTIKDNTIIFYNDPFTLFPLTTGVNDNGDPVTTIECWAYCSEDDIGGVTDFFGTYVGINTRAADIFERLTNIVWDLYVSGATINNINTFLLVLTDCDEVTQEGTVKDIFTEAGREWVLTENGLYSAPEGTGVIVSVNAVIYKGQNIWDTFKVYDGYSTIPDTVVPSFRVEAGYLGGGYISGLTFANKEVPLDFAFISTNPDYEVLTTDTGEWLIHTDNGDDIVLTGPDSYYSSALQEQGVVMVPIFEIGGFQEDIDKLHQAMANNIWATKTDVYAALTAGQAPPFTINPFLYIQENALKNNIIFININADDLVDTKAVVAAIRYLVNTVPAGTTFMLSLNSGTLEEEFDTQTQIEETVTWYIVAELEDEYDYTNIEETLNVNKKVG